MKTITIRGVDEATAQNLKKKSRENKQSMNQFVLNLIQQALNMGKQKRFTAEYNDLDDLFNSWSQQEFDTIQRKISAERKIDQELWK